MTTKTPRTAKAAAVSGTPSFRLECVTLLAASLERELADRVAEVERDAARWKAGESLAQFPEFCGHWQGRPDGQGWYHAATGERWYATAREAMDAAIKLEGKP